MPLTCSRILISVIAVLLYGHPIFSQSQDKVLGAEKIIKLVPEKLTGFFAEDSKSKVVKLGTIQYAIAEKTFRGRGKGKQMIKILLFDYKEAPIMYNQATRKWSTYTAIESDSLILRPAVITNCTGWESYNVYRKNSQIILGICDRFFLTIEGTNIDLESLKKVVQDFKFENYPK